MGLCDISLYLNGVRAPLNFLARDRFLSLLLLHIVLLQIAAGPIADSCFANLGWVPIAKPVFGYLHHEVGAGTFKPSSPIHFEASAKASAHFLIAKPILATCRDFCLPGVG
jgi:hypothetical protein